MIHCFESQSCRHSTVTNYGNTLPVGFPFDFRGNSHSKSSRNRSRGVANTESIIRAFAPFWKTADTTIFAICVEIIFSACKDFMAVCLVSNIPYKLIIWGIKDIMKGYRKLHHSEACAEVTSLNAHDIYYILA